MIYILDIGNSLLTNHLSDGLIYAMLISKPNCKG